MARTNSFNIEFLKKLIRLLHLFFPASRHSLRTEDYQERFYSHPFVLLLLILLNSVALQFVIYLVGLLSSAFYSELQKPPNQRDFPAFRWLVIRSFALVALNAFLKSLSTFLSSLLYIKWRTRLVLYLHSFYFTQQRYYHLSNTTQQNLNKQEAIYLPIQTNVTIQSTDTDNDEHNAKPVRPTNAIRCEKLTKLGVDNPDQRIVQDADLLCRTLSIIIPLIVISPFTIAYYTYRTWRVTGFYGPLAIFVYFIIWTAINKIFISAVSRTIFRQNICEGNFRFLHTQIRTYNEPIAFYNGGSFEHHRFDNYFLKALSPLLYRRSIQEFFLSLSTNLFDYIGSILSYLLLALAIFAFHFYDNTSSTDLIVIISQTSFMTMYLIYCFSQLNDIADQATIIAANTHRVQTLIEYMVGINTTWVKKQMNKHIDNNEILVIKNLTYSTPTNHKYILMKNLNLSLLKGQHLLITGESGVGKTSLFRILHSIWPINIHGSFSFNIDRSFLLPQRPYFTNQSLHDELSYPNTQHLPTVIPQAFIEQLLNDWKLSHILEYVQSSVFASPKYAWQDLLSPGELQRLSFVRLILHFSFNESHVNLIFLDEITSSVDVETERRMYSYLLEQNVTLISIGHRETLREYHQLQLKLSKNERYSIENLSDIRLKSSA